MKNKVFKIKLIALLAFMVPFAGFSQERITEEVDITRPYRPRLTEVAKIDVSPQNESPETELPVLDYKVDAMPAELPVVPPDIRPVQLGRERLPQLYRNYAKLGAGNFSNLYADIYYNSLRNERQLVAARLYHNSGKGPLQHSQFRENELSVHGKQMFRANVLSADFAYRNDKVHYHGHADSVLETLVRNEIRQVFNHLELQASFDNSMADSGKMNYYLNAGYHFFADSYKAAEHNPFISAGVTEYFNLNEIKIDGGFNHHGYTFEGNANPSSVLKVNAAFRLNKPEWWLSAGFKTATILDTLENENAFSFFPDVRGEAKLAGDFLILFAGITGGVDENSFRGLMNENPFMVSNPLIRHTRKLFEIYGGAKGTLSNRMAASAGVVYQNMGNLYMFVNDSIDTSRFAVVYDKNTNIFSFNGEVIYELTNRFKFGFSAGFHRYSLSNEEHAWHRPGVIAGIHARYNMEDKISIHSTLHAHGKRYATIAGSNKVDELAPFADLNLGINYRFNPTFTAFVDFKNILSRQYQLYNHYPVRGFNVLGGLALNF